MQPNSQVLGIRTGTSLGGGVTLPAILWIFQLGEQAQGKGVHWPKPQDRWEMVSACDPGNAQREQAAYSVSPGPLLTNHRKLRWPQRTKIHSRIVQEAQSLESRCWWRWVPPDNLREKLLTTPLALGSRLQPLAFLGLYMHALWSRGLFPVSLLWACLSKVPF